VKVKCKTCGKPHALNAVTMAMLIERAQEGEMHEVVRVGTGTPVRTVIRPLCLDVVLAKMVGEITGE
jgi:hypothetical protein